MTNIPTGSALLSAKFQVTLPHGSHNDFAELSQLAKGRLRTQFHKPTIETQIDETREGSNRPVSEYEDTPAEIIVTVGALRHPGPSEHRSGIFDRSMSEFKHELSKGGCES